jgi:DNA ligase-1
MKNFADLYANLDATNSTNEKITFLADYFATADPANAAWAVYFLSGQRPRRAVSNTQMADWAADEAGIPEWLYQECYDAVADSAETITLLLPDTGTSSDKPLRWWVEERLLPLADMDETEQRETIVSAWHTLNTRQRFIWNKLITGGFRVGVSTKLVTRALAEVSGVDRATIAHRLMGDWQPSPKFYTSLISTETQDADISRPYPFCLAYPLQDDDEIRDLLTDPAHWQIEWKWDGIRSQIIKRQGQVFIWSRGEELITDTYPEIAEMAQHLPDGVALDGEILAWKNGDVLPFGRLQKRIGRKRVTAKLQQNIPVICMVYDLLEHNGEDIRQTPVEERRALLEAIVTETAQDALILSPQVTAPDYDALKTIHNESRDRGVEGFMLKKHGSSYHVGRKKGDWWKWKVDPYTVDAIMIYAQRGSGKRAGLYTDYTFGIHADDDKIVPFAKAYSGLTHDEIEELDNWIRNNYREKFGPVRSVPAEQVFEIAFEGIRRSNRHKSGVAVRFPRILRWRKDKPPAEADHLDTVKQLLPELPDDD